MLRKLFRPGVAPLELPIVKPTSPLDVPKFWIHAHSTRRYTRILVSVLLSLSLLRCWHKFTSEHEAETSLQNYISTSDLPPLYEQYHEYERNLPQHDPTLPFPNGKHAKFLFFANHVNGVGFGNALQEIIMNAHLAYLTDRSFVFHNYTWDRDGPEYSKFKDNIIPSRIPFSTMISGPVVGGSFAPSKGIPRAVSTEYYHSVCPPEERTIINVEETIAHLENPSGMDVLELWVSKISSMHDRCIEMDQESNQVFDIWFFGSQKALDIWPSLSHSPILKNWGWSPLILSAYLTNRHLFEEHSTTTTPSLHGLSDFFPESWSSTSPLPSSSSSYTHLEGLLVLHIRRGDFKDHCAHLAEWSSEFNGWNTFDTFPDSDKFTPILGKNTQQKMDIYFSHCLPTISEIVRKVRGASERKGLKRIYVMTNAPVDWLDELKIALQEDATRLSGGEGWEMITTSRDLTMSKEQKYVAQALDMYVAHRAQVFVGNGFSSLSSNVAMLRLFYELDPQDTRFW